MARALPSLLVAATTLLGCLPRAAPPAARPGSPPIDDRARIRRLEQEAQRLIDAGTTVPMAELIGQLGRKTCSPRLRRPDRRPMGPSRVYAELSRSVLVVGAMYKCTRCPRWHAVLATGFLVSPSGAFVTTYHVVNAKDKHTLVAMTRDGRVFPVRQVLAASEADDVAILQLDAGGEKLEPLALAQSAPVGEAVWVISHPDKRLYALTRGHVSRHAVHAKGGRRVETLEITADFARGSSGAPVLNARGAAVGVVRSTHSVYYKQSSGKQQNLQMVFKQCAPARSILQLIE
jgi:serine protease Do